MKRNETTSKDKTMPKAQKNPAKKAVKAPATEVELFGDEDPEAETKVDKAVSTAMVRAGEKLRKMRNQKKELDDNVKALEDAIDKTDRKLAEMMQENNILNFSHNGYTYTLNIRISTSTSNERKADFHQALRNHDENDLVQETVNSSSLKAYVGRQMKTNGGEIPKWLREFVKVVEIPTVKISRGEGR